MKRLIPFLLLLFCLGCKGVSAAEYDTLFLRNESQIRCTITEMTETAVSYTRADRPRTMVFTTPIEQIARILFSDGTEAQITAATTETTQTQPTTSEERTAAKTERVVDAPQCVKRHKQQHKQQHEQRSPLRSHNKRQP